VLRNLLDGGQARPTDKGRFEANPEPAVSRFDTARVDESSDESFPASDPPAR
jgi:hypothetical protein